MFSCYGYRKKFIYNNYADVWGVLKYLTLACNLIYSDNHLAIEAIVHSVLQEFWYTEQIAKLDIRISY